MNPYLMPEPSLISFSGGRTSGYMLYQILRAHGGKLPKDILPVFRNTGKEREETLEFVRECGRRWNVDIVWIEYAAVENPAWRLAVNISRLLRRWCGVRLAPRLNRWKHTQREVTFETASRNGEPFRDLIRTRSYLPNVVTRFCTAQLKIRPAQRYMQSRGYKAWTTAIGIRADEPHRIKSQNAEPYETRVHPLYEAGATVEDVMAFWAKQPFDLQLRQDEGNCDLCLLKGRKKLKRLILERPESADWWIAQEQKISTRAASPTLARFNKERSYSQLRESIFSLPLYEQPSDIDDEVADCHCTD